MPKTITIKGKSPVDEASRFEAMTWFNDNATTEELQKIMKLAKNPLKRAMLKSL
jgi:hypothetical protein